MAVHIRLRRGGKKKEPRYRIVVADSRSPRDGRFIEVLGQYEPIPENEKFEFDRERLVYWLKQGAKPSDTIKSLLRRKGLWGDISAEISSSGKKKPESELRIESNTEQEKADKDVEEA